MVAPTTLKIDEVEYIRKDSIPPVKPNTDGPIKIVVLDRGFVYVGCVAADAPDGFLKLTNASNIRVWGTTKGLGELVAGPTHKTKLDSVGTISAPLRAVISLIDVEQGKWKGC